MGGGNRSGPIDVAATLTAKGQHIDFEVETFIASHDISQTLLAKANSSHRADAETYIAFQTRGSNVDVGDISGTLGSNSGSASGCAPMIAHTLRGEGFDASEDGTGRGIPLVPENFVIPLMASGHEGSSGAGIGAIGDPAFTMDTRGAQAIAFDCKASGRNGFGVGDIAPTLRAMGHKDSHQNSGGQIAVQQGWAVRRLTPIECARLQGFPDHHSRIPWRGKPAEQCPDGPQYKTFGNSMAVKVMAWIGTRLDRTMMATKPNADRNSVLNRNPSCSSALDRDRGAGTLFAEVGK